MIERRAYSIPADGSMYRKVGVLMPDGAADIPEDTSGSRFYTFIFFFSRVGK